MMRSDSGDNLRQRELSEDQVSLQEGMEEKCDDDDDKSEVQYDSSEKAGNDWRKLWHSQQEYWREKEKEDDASGQCVVYDENGSHESTSPARIACKGSGEEISGSVSDCNDNNRVQEESKTCLNDTLCCDTGTTNSSKWGILEKLQSRHEMKQNDLEDTEATSGFSALLPDAFTRGSLKEEERLEQSLSDEIRTENAGWSLETTLGPRWSVLKRLRERLEVEATMEENSEKDAISLRNESPGKEAKAKPNENSCGVLDGRDESKTPTGEENQQINQHPESNENNSSRWTVLSRLRQKAAAQGLTIAGYETLDNEKESANQKDALPDGDDTFIEASSRPNVIEMRENVADDSTSPRLGWGLLKKVQEKLSEMSDDKHETNDCFEQSLLMANVTGLHTRNIELENHVQELLERNSALRNESKLNAAKVLEFTEDVKAKQNNIVEEKLLNKSIQNAEFLMKINDLSMELDRANSSILRLQKEREEHIRLIDRMGNVFVALHAAQDFAPTWKKPEESTTVITVDELETVINDIMDDREQLVKRCQDLERQNEEKDERIDGLVHALDSQAFNYDSDGSVLGKEKGDDHSTRSEMTKSTCASTVFSSMYAEAEDRQSGSKFRSLYKSISSRMVLRGGADDDHSVMSDMGSVKSETTQSTYGASQSTLPSFPDCRDDLDSIKERMINCDPKYLEFLNLMKGTELTGESCHAISEEPDEFEESPEEHPDEEHSDREGLIVGLVL
eukprot:scaffold543_cov119-Cylindrotheca_fusiformis.AAC.30